MRISDWSSDVCSSDLLRFGLTRFRRLPDPFEFVLDRLLASGVLARFLFEALALLFQIGRIIALVDEIAAAIEFEDPIHDIVEEIAVVGDEDDVARIVDEMLSIGRAPSELQSLMRISSAVFCLKKNSQTIIN